MGCLICIASATDGEDIRLASDCTILLTVIGRDRRLTARCNDEGSVGCAAAAIGVGGGTGRVARIVSD